MSAAAGPPGLHIRLLGTFEIEGVDLRALTSRKARTLLKRLALAGGDPVSVDHLVECLWGDAAGRPARPEREVAVNASRARSIVGAERLVRDDGGYRLAVDRSDLQDLVALDDRARTLLDAGDVAAARTAATAALARCRGPLLADEPDPRWAEAERADVARRIGSLRRLVAEAALAAGDRSTAAGSASAALEHDPYDEGALRVLMAAQVADGRPASALAAYARFRERLAEDLGVGPSAETDLLHTAILLAPDAADAPSAPAGDAPAPPPGREDAFGALVATFDGARGRGRVVSLVGEGGAGKSTVLEAFGAWCRWRSAVVLRGACEDGVDLPLQPVGDALADHLATLDADERDRLLGPDRALLAPVLGDDEHIPASATPAPLPDDATRRSELFGALARVLRSIADGRRIVLLLDDGHRAGPTTTAWLGAVARTLDLPLLVVVARRSVAAATAAVPSEHPVVLGPLDPAAASRVVGADVDPDLIDAADGNLLLLVELVAHRRGDGATAAGGAGAVLPASLRAAVGAQLADLGTAADTLRVAASLGSVVDLDLLAGTLGRPPLEVLADLELGLDRRVLVDGARGITFRHDLVREALEEDLSSTRRALLHRDAVAILLARGTPAEPLVLAHHARLAGDTVVAADALAAAAERCAARFDLDDAIELLTEAIGFDDRAELRLARGRLHIGRADFDAADEDGLAARRLGAGAEALALRAWVARHRHDLDTAIRLGEEGARTATDPITRTSCLLVVGFARKGLGDLRAADAELSEALASAGPEDATLRGWLGVLRVHQGRAQDALALLEPAVGGEAGGLHGFWVEHVLQMDAHALTMTGRVGDALSVLDRLDRELHRRGSHARYDALVANYRAWILRHLGDPSAQELSEAALGSGALVEARVQAALDLADGHLSTGRLDDARTSLDRADQLAEVQWFSNRWRCEQRSLLLRARWGMGTGGRDAAVAAEGHATLLVDQSEARGDERYLTLGRIVLARARAAQGAAVDRDAVAVELGRLPMLAALEAWWITAEVARDLDVSAWVPLAERRVHELAIGAGSRRGAFEAHAAVRLDHIAGG